LGFGSTLVVFKVDAYMWGLEQQEHALGVRFLCNRETFCSVLLK
jgi:hypothetical protein